MAHVVTTTAPAPATEGTRYVITSNSRGDIETTMEAVRTRNLPSRVRFTGPYMLNGMFVAEGTTRDYVEAN